MRKAFKGLIASIAMALVIFSGTVFANAQDVKLTVEGMSGSLYEQTVQAQIGDSAEDLFKNALGEDNFKGSTSDYGFMVEEINGEIHTWPTDGGYWELLVDLGNGYQRSTMGLTGVKVSEGTKALMLHVNRNIGTPIVSYENGCIRVQKEVTEYDENWNEIKTILPAAQSTVEVNGQTYTTDESGYAKADLSNGSYSAKVLKQGEDGYPQVYRFEVNFDVQREKFSSSLANYTEFKNEMGVGSQKEFKIEFSQNVDKSSAEKGIYIVDSNGYIIRPQVSVDGKTVQLSAPYGGYSGGSYNIVIENTVKSASSKQLLGAVRMEFNVE